MPLMKSLALHFVGEVVVASGAESDVEVGSLEGFGRGRLGRKVNYGLLAALLFVAILDFVGCWDFLF